MKFQRKLYKRRRRESKTNYRKRLTLLKSENARFVIRKTNKYIILQIVESKQAQDKVLYTISTKDLLKFGWPKENIGSLKSLAASYLSGLLIGKKALKYGIKKVVLDSGLIPSTKGSRIYAAVKGVTDSGIEISYDSKVIPSKEMIEKYNFFNKVKEEIK